MNRVTYLYSYAPVTFVVLISIVSAVTSMNVGLCLVVLVSCNIVFVQTKFNSDLISCDIKLHDGEEHGKIANCVGRSLAGAVSGISYTNTDITRKL